MSRKKELEQKGILVLEGYDEKREIEFELNYLLAMSTFQRFHLMQTKSQELRSNLEKNGYRRTPQIIKRK